MDSKFKVNTAFLVDDSEVDLFIQKKFIELSSFAEHVFTFSSPIKALEALHRTDYDETRALLFLDLNMPLLSGFEFLEKINPLSSGASSGIKVVILTSSNSPADRLKAKEFPNVIRFFFQATYFRRLAVTQPIVGETRLVIQHSLPVISLKLPTFCVSG